MLILDYYEILVFDSSCYDTRTYADIWTAHQTLHNSRGNQNLPGTVYYYNKRGSDEKRVTIDSVSYINHLIKGAKAHCEQIRHNGNRTKALCSIWRLDFVVPTFIFHVFVWYMVTTILIQNHSNKLTFTLAIIMTSAASGCSAGWQLQTVTIEPTYLRVMAMGTKFKPFSQGQRGWGWTVMTCVTYVAMGRKHYHSRCRSQ